MASRIGQGLRDPVNLMPGQIFVFCRCRLQTLRRKRCRHHHLYQVRTAPANRNSVLY
ncbi:MAG: hypothetical protein ACYCOX_18750 [Acidobacteriaceae bacterium]